MSAPGKNGRPQILVCDDEQQILRALRVILRDNGYEALPASTGEEALDVAAVSRPAAGILDLVLPDIDGVELCRRLREWTDMPIILLSAVGEEDAKVRALAAGADDYVTKPFGPAELRSRIRAVLRRAGPRALGDEVLRVGPLVLDRSSRAVSAHGEPVELTFSEFEVLQALMGRPGVLFSRQELLSAIWGDSAYRDPRGIDVHIRHLREKLERVPERPELLLTVRGVGYRLHAP
jgi:DNA-binding response OmpR family regulator